ncbi:MAG: LPP20 family lipoprotein [Candidatus Delongbacteria bacterium]|nr:LPP20 family lipoprotein [Candidatus Delongbacteria bacterium]
MKFKLIFVSLSVFFLIVGCATTNTSTTTVSKDDCIPEWFLTPPYAEDAIYGTGQSEKASASLGQKSADTRAKQDISEQIQIKVKSYVKDFLQEVGALGDSDIDELTSSTVKVVSESDLSGARIKQRENCGNTWYSLCEYRIDTAAKLVTDTLQKEMEKKKLKEQFEAKLSFEELEKEVERAFGED